MSDRQIQHLIITSLSIKKKAKFTRLYFEMSRKDTIKL